jgi:hypothetical protein
VLWFFQACSDILIPQNLCVLECILSCFLEKGFLHCLCLFRLYRAVIYDLGGKKFVYLFETVRDTNMKQFENIMGTHKVYPEMFDICAITQQARTRYSNSSHVRRNCDSSTFAVVCKIRYRRD